MQHRRLVIAGVGVAVAAGIGGITAVAASSSRASTSSSPATATVHTLTAAVGGKSEQILGNAQGLPLYYYQPDTATSSEVDAGVARLWPPLTSAVPSASGVKGAVTVVHDAYGNQVAYRGHLLYTFVSDRAGQVTGQGVQNFFVATPGLAPLAGSVAPPTSAPAAPSAGYGY
jgi:predicted lipoprotein with Yx(FWY)xxD motif